MTDIFAIHTVLCASFFVAFWSISNTKEFESQNFVIFPSYRLDSTNQPGVLVKELLIANQMMCADECFQISSCLSFNLEKKTKSNKNTRKCELLAVNDKLRTELVREDKDFDLYSTQDPCGKDLFCQNSGTCVNSPSFRCVCTDGYEGMFCEISKDPCAKDLLCQNNGTCVKSPTSFRCVCKDGYEGKYCEIISECVHYQNLTETDRNINYGVVTKTWDGRAVIKTGNWYRFAGPAGSRMLDFCPTSSKCNADFNGWIDSQPKPGEVRVKRTVQKRAGGKCNYWPQTILATNCGDFNVYQLKPLNKYVRYCGTD